MATANKFGDSLNANFKEAYGDEVKDLIPEGLKLYNTIKFAAKDKQPGNLFHQPVILGHEHGVTFAASDDDAFNLNAAVAGAIKDAQVRGNPIVIRSLLGYNAAQRALQGGSKAFKDSTKFLVGNMLRSICKKLEIELFYGQMGYATIASVAGNVLTITTAEWAPGIWAGAENMPIEIRTSANAVRGECVVSSVDLSGRTVTVNALPAGVAGTDVIWHKGAYGNEFAGIHKILTNTGTLFNISASDYSLWKGNSYNANGALSMAKVELSITLGVQKGLEGDVTMFVNPRGWADLLVEQSALRNYDSSYKDSEVVNGGKSIKFYSANGSVEIVPSIYVKEGYSYILFMEDFMRIGSTDVSFKSPGGDGEFFRHVENAAAYELRAYSDQALFCSSPGKNVVITGIVNTA